MGGASRIQIWDHTTLNNNNKEREILLIEWIKKNFAKDFQLIPIQGDASFRRYFRIVSNDTSWVIMDAPPELENILPFIAVAKGFAKQGLHVPAIFAFDEALGLILLSDLGDEQYFRIMKNNDARNLYNDATQALLKLQACRDFPEWELPHYDATLLHKELELFRTWYLQQHLGLKLSADENALIDEIYAALINSAKSQPQVCVHRDYHSRNLHRLADDHVGILDFQDAVFGPITYDLVSLLRDCYLTWPQSFVHAQALKYQELLIEQAVLTGEESSQFLQWFDWMGLQRHLKVLGIFARLYYRDGKEIYLNELPRVMSYVLFVCQRYSLFTDFLRFLQLRVLPNEGNDFSGRTRDAYGALNR